MDYGVPWWLLLLTVVAAEKWRWPEASASVRIDTKVRFIDSENESEAGSVKEKRRDRVLSDEVPFREPSDTEGFYNRPPGAGRFPVRVEPQRARPADRQAVYPVHKQDHSDYNSDGTLDSLQYCKCVSSPDCSPRLNARGTCGLDKYLCCYRRPQTTPHSNEFFNEVEDERPMLLPGQENLARPFPPPPGSVLTGFFGPFGPGHPPSTSLIGVFDKPQGLLVGPDGPTGSIGPQEKPSGSPNVLVGPGGPTGIIGPTSNKNNDGHRSASAQRGVLVGPVGPSGLVGSYGRRPVLVGPGGPTGIIGPRRGPGVARGPGVLVGPGGPTGIVGPGYGRRPGPSLLTGPDGPTGSVGPFRPILVGPTGPSGHIGPQGHGK